MFLQGFFCAALKLFFLLRQKRFSLSFDGGIFGKPVFNSLGMRYYRNAPVQQQ
jgi:hypothetical protein